MASTTARLNAALREIGKLSAIIDKLRAELAENQHELAQARRAAAPSRTPAEPPSSAVSDSLQNQIKALNFQLVHERKQHSAQLELLQSKLQDQRDIISEIERSNAVAKEQFVYLNGTAVRAADDGTETLVTLETALAAIGALSIPSIKPCVDGLYDVFEKLRSCAMDNAELVSSAENLTSPAAAGVAAERLSRDVPVVSAAAHIRREKVTATTSRSSGRSVQRPKSVGVKPISSKFSEASVMSDAPLNGSGQTLLRSICTDLTKENNRLRLEISSMEQNVNHLRKQLAKAQREADAAATADMAMQACREHATLLENKISMQEDDLAQKEKLLRQLAEELRHVSMQRDDAVQRLDFALRRQALGSDFAPKSYPSRTLEEERHTSPEVTRTPVALEVKMTSARANSQRALSSSTSRSIPKTTSQLLTSTVQARTRSAQPSKPVSEPSGRPISRNTSTKRPAVAAAQRQSHAHVRQQRASPSTLSTSGTESTATTEFMHHVNSIMHSSSLAPPCSPAVTQQIFREVLNQSLESLSHMDRSQMSAAAPTRVLRGDTTVESAVPASSTVQAGDIFRQLREMDNELETLSKRSVELHARAARKSSSSSSSSHAKPANAGRSRLGSISSDSLEESAIQKPAYKAPRDNKMVDISWVSEVSDASSLSSRRPSVNPAVEKKEPQWPKAAWISPSDSGDLSDSES